MVIAHQKFDFRGKCLIEKIVIQPPFRLSVNFHDSACFIYFLEGEARINSPGEQARIRSNESVVLKCGSYFADLLRYCEADRCEILVVHLYPEMLRQIYKQDIPAFIAKAEGGSFVQNIEVQEVVKKFVESLCFYFDNPLLVSDELLELKVRELILLLIQTKSAASVANLFSDLYSPRHLTIKEVVNNHLFSDLEIEDLATLANVSVSTFAREFQILFDDTPANYIRKQRLERAKDLLVRSKLTISEIAFQTCFNDVAHLSRCFKAAFGHSPSAHRSSAKGS